MIDAGKGAAVLVSNQDIVNQGGSIRGGAALLAAARDVHNESMALTQSYASSQTRQLHGAVEPGGDHGRQPVADWRRSQPVLTIADAAKQAQTGQNIDQALAEAGVPGTGVPLPHFSPAARMVRGAPKLSAVARGAPV